MWSILPLQGEIKWDNQEVDKMTNEIDIDKNKPEKAFRASPISATIWTNEATTKDGETRLFRTITLERTYKDKEGAWQKTNSLRVNDLPKAELVLRKCYEYITIKEQGDNGIIEE